MFHSIAGRSGKSDLARLKSELARLKSELARLKSEKSVIKQNFRNHKNAN